MIDYTDMRQTQRHADRQKGRGRTQPTVPKTLNISSELHKEIEYHNEENRHDNGKEKGQNRQGQGNDGKRDMILLHVS